MRKLLWRVRTRLLVTYVLLGALPIALLVVFAYVGFYLVLGQAANYLLHAEIDERLGQLHASADQLASAISRGENLAPVPQANRTTVRTTHNTGEGFPVWSTVGFKRILKSPDGAHFLGAHGTAGEGDKRVDTFVYQNFDEDFLSKLMPGAAALYVVSGAQVRVSLGRTTPANSEIRVLLDSENVLPPPDARNFLDGIVDTASPLHVRLIEDGREEEEAIGLVSRASAVLGILFSTLGSEAPAVGILLLMIALTFVVVEIVAVTFSIRLTRTITRAVHEMYQGTRKVEAGDFTHRITVRAKDQLGELGSSFNSMTARIEQLIVEAKEKEKLQAELEIARQVQAQLFPKNIPQLKTLELTGVCLPARVVSGDYYDFIPIGSHSAAIIIGDISGKGISAALLMASVQSSLHAQLAMGADELSSTAALVSRLNRQLYENSPSEKYATFYCGIYDDRAGRLIYTNAGHLAPAVIRRGNVIGRRTIRGRAPAGSFDSKLQQTHRRHRHHRYGRRTELVV